MISGTKFNSGRSKNAVFCQSGLESGLFSRSPLTSPGITFRSSKTVSHFRSFSSFQGLQVICNGIGLPIGAIRAHFKPLKPVLLLKKLRTAGFFKKGELNSRFLALNSPQVRSRTTFFANRSPFKANLGCMTFPLPGDPCGGTISTWGFGALENGLCIIA